MGRFVELLLFSALVLSCVEASTRHLSVVHSLKPALKPNGVCDIDLDNDIVILNYKGINCTERANVNDRNIGEATGYPVMGFSMDGETCYQGSMSHPSSDYAWTEGKVYIAEQTCPHSAWPDMAVARYDEYPAWPSGRSTGSPTGTGRVFTQCDAVNGAVSKSYGPDTTNCDGSAVETADTTIFWGMKGSYQMTGEPISDDEGMIPGECVNSWGDHLTGFEYSSKLYCPGTLSEIPSEFLEVPELTPWPPHAAACCPHRNVTNTCDCKDYDSTSHASIQWFHVNGEGCLDENVYNQRNPFVWFPDVIGACISMPEMETTHALGAKSMEWIGCADDGSAKLHFYMDHDCVGAYEKVDAIENECYDDRLIVRCHGNNNTLWNTKSECHVPPPFVNLTLLENVTTSDGSDAASTTVSNLTADSVNSTATETALVSDATVNSTITDSTTTLLVSTETSTSTIIIADETVTEASTVAPASGAFGMKSSLVGVFGMLGLKRMISPMGLVSVGVMLVWSVKGHPTEIRTTNFSNGDLGNRWFETSSNYGTFKYSGMRNRPPYPWYPLDLCKYDPSTDWLEIVHATDSCACSGAITDLDSAQIIIWKKDIQLASSYVEQLWGTSGGCFKIVDCDADKGIMGAYYDLEETCDGDIGAADGDDDFISHFSWFRGGTYSGGGYKHGDYGWRNESWLHDPSAFVSLGKAIDESTGEETNAVNAPCRDMGCVRSIYTSSGPYTWARHCEWSIDKLFSASYWCELGKKPSWLVPTHADFNVKHGCSGVPASSFTPYYRLHSYAYNHTAYCTSVTYGEELYNHTYHGAVSHYGDSDAYGFKYLWYFYSGSCSWSGHSWDWKSFRANCAAETRGETRIDVEWFTGETCDPSQRGAMRYPNEFGTVNRVGNRFVKYESFAQGVIHAHTVHITLNLGYYGTVTPWTNQGSTIWSCPGTNNDACGGDWRLRTNFTGFTEKIEY